MKRFHVHVSVDNLSQNIEFYSQLFGQPPAVEKADYAKWMLDDPRINFAISTRHTQLGVNHFGFQAENEQELAELKQRAQAAAGEAVLDQGATTCCYAKSDKHWTVDPSGFAWEHYLTMGEIKEFGVEANDSSVACCVPTVTSTKKPLSITIKAEANKCCSGNNPEKTSC